MRPLRHAITPDDAAADIYAAAAVSGFSDMPDYFIYALHYLFTLIISIR